MLLCLSLGFLVLSSFLSYSALLSLSLLSSISLSLFANSIGANLTAGFLPPPLAWPGQPVDYGGNFSHTQYQQQPPALPDSSVVRSETQSAEQVSQFLSSITYDWSRFRFSLYQES